MTENKTTNSANSTTNVIIIALVVLLVIMSILFFNEKSKGASGASRSTGEIVSPLADDEVILRYSGGEIKARDLKGNITPKVKQMAEEVIEMYKKSAENTLIEKLLNDEAKKKGLPNIQALLESIGTTTEVTDKEITDFMTANNLLKGFKDPTTGKMRKVSKDEIRNHLMNKDKVAQRQSFIDKLITSANIQWALKEPKTPVPALTADEPVLGNRNAKVLIYEHSDFQCPYCSRGKAVVHEIHKEYGDKVGIVFRHLPLDFHPEAKPSAKASICAQAQGKFWEYHDKLFDNQKELGAANYTKWAKEVGLDEGKFTSCLTSAETEKILSMSMAMSEQAGANSTPTFFIATKDGAKKVAGAQPFAEFKKIIDEELR